MTDPAGPAAAELSALIGVLAVLGGEVRSGQLPLDIAWRVRQRLVRAGVLGDDRQPGDLFEALSQIGERLRTLEAHDEHEDRALEDLPLVNVLAFDTEEAALSFAEQMGRRGRDVDPPAHEDRYRRWVVAIHTREREVGMARAGQEFAAARELGGWHLGAF